MTRNLEKFLVLCKQGLNRFSLVLTTLEDVLGGVHRAYPAPNYHFGHSESVVAAIGRAPHASRRPRSRGVRWSRGPRGPAKPQPQQTASQAVRGREAPSGEEDSMVTRHVRPLGAGGAGDVGNFGRPRGSVQSKPPPARPRLPHKSPADSSKPHLFSRTPPSAAPAARQLAKHSPKPPPAPKPRRVARKRGEGRGPRREYRCGFPRPPPPLNPPVLLRGRGTPSAKGARSRPAAPRTRTRAARGNPSRGRSRAGALDLAA